MDSHFANLTSYLSQMFELDINEEKMQDGTKDLH